MKTRLILVTLVLACVIWHDTLWASVALNWRSIQTLRAIRDPAPGGSDEQVAFVPSDSAVTERFAYMDGRLAAARGSQVHARDALHDAVTLDPSDAVAQFELAQAQQALGNRSASIASLRNAHASIFFTRVGDERLRAGQIDDAIAQFQTAADIDPTPSALVTLGSAQDSAMAWDDAERNYRAALVIEPADTQALERLAIDLMDHSSQPDQAASLLEQVVSLSPKQSVWSYMRLAELARNRNDTAEARRWYQSAITMFPERGEPRTALATL